MKQKRTFFLFVPLVVLFALSLGFYYSTGGNTALTVAEQLGTTNAIPVVNQEYQTDMIGAWTTGASLPSARYYGGSVSYTRNDSGFVYVFGGDSTGGGIVGVNMYRYNVAANTWSVVSQVPAPRRIGGSARIADSIYVVGGISNAAPCSFNVYRYSINQNTWAQVANMPDSLQFNRAQGYQDSLMYNVGGYNGGAAKTVVYLYNAKNNTWRGATNLPAARADGALSISGDTLVYVCGFDATGFATNVVYRGVISQSDRSQITWTTGTAYPAGSRSRIYAAPWGPKGIIVAGGASSGFTGTNDCYTYSPGANVWTLQANMPAVLLAYHSGSVRYSSGIWKFIASAGVTTGPALTANTYIFTDTLSVIPPLSPSTLVLMHDTTITDSKVKRLADRDTLLKHLPSLITGYDVMYFNSSTTLPSIASYKTIIIQETSYDGISGNLGMSASMKTDLKAWIVSGGSADKRALIQIGGDFGYYYDRSGASFLDTTYSRQICGFQYVSDNGQTPTDSSVIGVTIDVGNERVLTAPLGNSAGFYPDACKPVNGGTQLSKYKGRTSTDSSAVIGKVSGNYVVVTGFQDPRYFKPVNQFKAYLAALIGYVKSNGGTVTSVTNPLSSVAEKYSLSQNYPNPFNPTTKINFAIPSNGFVSLKVFDISGKEVMTLVNKNMTTGSYSVDFNGAFLSSGVYFYRLQSNDFVETKKMMLVK